jgi:transcriptional activator protein UGA3
MGRKRTACGNCTSIKAACDQMRPCGRCRRLALDCHYGETRLLVQETSEHRKLGYPRSKTGCANCRRRKKKCDERQPVCGDCKRLGLACLPFAPEQNVSLVEDQSSNQHTSVADWVDLIEYEGLEDSPMSRGLVSSAALVDLPIPKKEEDIVAYATFLPATALNNLAGVRPSSLSTWDLGERHLLNHFLQSVSRALVLVQDDNNPFLRAVVPIALDNTMVKHSLLALSACHISSVYPVFKRDLLRHRNRALSILQTTVDENESVEEALLTTMLLCLADVS